MSLLEELDKERYRRDCHTYVFEAVRTKDEHDIYAPVKQFPDELCLKALLDDYLVSGRLKKPNDAQYSLEARLGEERRRKMA